MKLHDINRGPRDNKYCGPAVISFISGINTTHAAALIRQYNPSINAVKGAYTQDVLRTLWFLGYDTTRQFIDGDRPTLKTWLRDIKEKRTAGRVFLVVAGYHFQIISGRKYACGRIGSIVPLSDKRIKNRSRVVEAYEITPKVNQKALHADTMRSLEKRVQYARQEAANVQTARRRAHKIAKEYDMTIDVDRFPGGGMSIYFNVPDWMEEARGEGEFEYTTVAYDWFEAADLAIELEEAYREGQKRMLDCEPA